MSDPRILTVRPKEGEYAWTFGGAAPVARVEPGTFLDVYTEDCFAGRVRSEKDLVSAVCEFPFLNPQTGPFHVVGAEPGDTVAVHFVSIEPARDWAASTTVPLFGALTSTHTTASLQAPLPEVVWMWQLDRARRTCLFSARDSDIQVELPMDPMHGTVGVAPANLEVRSALVPDAHGGNMDTPEMRAGVTCYLGVNVEGALLSLGDGHARQGEGETCGVAVECAMNTVVLVELLKGVATPWPRIESDTHLISTGSARPLEDAFRISQLDLVQWLARDYGLSELDAYQLISQAGEARWRMSATPTTPVWRRSARIGCLRAILIVGCTVICGRLPPYCPPLDPAPTGAFMHRRRILQGAAATAAAALLPASTRAMASSTAGSTDYPLAHWTPASAVNYTASMRPSAYPVQHVIIHVTQEMFSDAIGIFQNPAKQVSAHYVVRSADGYVAQCVREQDIAWHAGNWDYNTRSVGIEHEGWVDQPAYFTNALYEQSALLTASVCDRYGIPKDREHILGHAEVPGTDHTDPGPNWDWVRYIRLVNLFSAG